MIKSPKKEIKPNETNNEKTDSNQNKKKEKCSSCLLLEKNCQSFSCGHVCCNDCITLSILALEYNKDLNSNKETSNKTEKDKPGKTSKQNQDFPFKNNQIKCVLCIKGISKQGITDFISNNIKNQVKNEEELLDLHCEGCESQEKQANPSISYCEICKVKLCPDCQVIHNSIQAFTCHRFIKGGSIQSIALLETKYKNELASAGFSSEALKHKLILPNCKCEFNNKPHFYCVSCNCNICTECMLISHSDHRFHRLSGLSLQNEVFGDLFGAVKSKPKEKDKKDKRKSVLSIGVEKDKTSITNQGNPVRTMSINTNSNSINKTSSRLDESKLQEEDLTLKYFKPRGSMYSQSLNVSPIRKSVMKIEEEKKLQLEMTKNIKEIVFNICDDPEKEFPILFPVEKEDGFEKNQFKLKIDDENQEILDGVCESPISIKKTCLAYENQVENEGKTRKILKRKENLRIEDDFISSIYKSNNITSILNLLKKVEKESSLKIKKEITNVNETFDFISSLSSDTVDLYKSKSILKKEKINSNLKEMKQLIYNLKDQFESNKIMSISQLEMIDEKIFSIIRKGKEYEKVLNYYLYKDLVTVDYKETEIYLKEKEEEKERDRKKGKEMQSLKGSLNKSPNKSIFSSKKNEYFNLKSLDSEEKENETEKEKENQSQKRKNQQNNYTRKSIFQSDSQRKSVISFFSEGTNKNLNFNDVLSLESYDIYHSKDISSSSLPHIFTTVYTKSRVLYILWINEKVNSIEGMKIELMIKGKPVDEILNKRKLSNEERKTILSQVTEKREVFLIKDYKTQSNTINSLRSFKNLSTDQYYIVSCLSNGTARIYKIDNTISKVVPYKTYNLNEGNVFSSYLHIPYNKDVNNPERHPRLAVCSFKKDCPIKIFDLNTDKIIETIKIKGSSFSIHMIDLAKEAPNCLNPKLKNKLLLLVSVFSIQYEVKVFDFSNYSYVYSIPLDSYMNSCFLNEELNVLHLIINDRNGSISLFDMEKETVSLKLSGFGYYNISKWNEKYFLSSGKTTVLEVISSAKLSSEMKYSDVHKDSIRNVVVDYFPGKGRCIFTYGEDKFIKVWFSKEGSNEMDEEIEDDVIFEKND